jgi:hypothetical protein
MTPNRRSAKVVVTLLANQMVWLSWTNTATCSALVNPGTSRRQRRGRQDRITGQTEYQLDANRLWDNIKTHAGWENDVVADIQARRSTCSASTRSPPANALKLAKAYLGDAGRYMDIWREQRPAVQSRPDRVGRSPPVTRDRAGCCRPLCRPSASSSSRPTSLGATRVSP